MKRLGVLGIFLIIFVSACVGNNTGEEILFNSLEKMQQNPNIEIEYSVYVDSNYPNYVTNNEIQEHLYRDINKLRLDLDYPNVSSKSYYVDGVSYSITQRESSGYSKYGPSTSTKPAFADYYNASFLQNFYKNLLDENKITIEHVKTKTVLNRECDEIKIKYKEADGSILTESYPELSSAGVPARGWTIESYETILCFDKGTGYTLSEDIKFSIKSDINYELSKTATLFLPHKVYGPDIFKIPGF